MSCKASPYYWSIQREDYYCRSCGAAIDIENSIASCPNDCFEPEVHEQ